MTYYTDKTPYTYSPETIPPEIEALNVGWLEPGKEFPRGEPSTSLIPSLTELIATHSKNKMRGWHRCQLDDCAMSTEYPVTFPHRENRMPLGGAEVRVVTEDGTWMIAPDLIIHYIVAHSYTPPEEFSEAVIAQRVAPDVKIP